MFDQRHPAAEATEGLRQFKPDIASAEDDKMLRKSVHLDGFNVSHHRAAAT